MVNQEEYTIVGVWCDGFLVVDGLNAMCDHCKRMEHAAPCKVFQGTGFDQTVAILRVQASLLAFPTVLSHSNNLSLLNNPPAVPLSDPTPRAWYLFFSRPVCCVVPSL